MANPGVQFAPGSAALSGSPLVHMPLSMSLAAMIPQPETQGAEPQLQILDLPQRPDHRLDPEPQGQSLDEDQEGEPGSPNLLDKLLEERGEDGDEDDKDSYSSSLFMPNVWKYERPYVYTGDAGVVFLLFAFFSGALCLYTFLPFSVIFISVYFNQALDVVTAVNVTSNNTVGLEMEQVSQSWKKGTLKFNLWSLDLL